MKTIVKNIFATAIALVATSTVLLAQPAAKDVSQVMWKSNWSEKLSFATNPIKECLPVAMKLVVILKKQLKQD